MEHMTATQLIEELEIIEDRVKKWYDIPQGTPADDVMRDMRWLIDFIYYTLDLQREDVITKA